MSSDTAAWYRRAAVELAGTSPRQVEWALGIADDPESLALIEQLPTPHRQPSLVFSAARFAGADDVPWAELRPWLLEHWPEIEPVARTRRTQTNEPGRCVPLLVALDRIPGPIALLELGASAGLCLLPDRYAYRFDDGPVLGSGQPVLDCATSGEGVAPTRLPQIVWRRGVDLAPLSVADESDRRWLEALLPPDRPDRAQRLRTACATAASDPPLVVDGDALEALARVAADAPGGATLVVASLGTAVYLPGEARGRLLPAIRALGARAVTFESVTALTEIAERLPEVSAPHPTPFVLALDGEPLAYGTPHGDRLSWVSPAGRADAGVAPT